MKHLLGLSIFFALCGCSPQRLFYYPNRVLYHDPDRMNLKSEVVQFPTQENRTLYALWLPTEKKPKATIVFFHGNFGNFSNHFPLSLFLVRNGFDVLAFDYQGYGASEGRPTPKGLIQDGLAATEWAYEHRRDTSTAVGIYAQSLGGHTAISVAAKDTRVKASVIEAAFSGHAAMARAVLGRHWWTWPFYPIVPLFVNHSTNAIRVVGRISPRPVFFIHGDADRIVPVEMSKRLFEAAGEPKTLWIIPGGDHLTCRRQDPQEYERRVVQFFERYLSTSPNESGQLKLPSP